MRLLVLDEKAKSEIQRVLNQALDPRNWYRPGKDSRLPGDDPRFVVHIQQGYRAVFSITEHSHGPTLRHLSVSVDGDKYPDIVATFMLAQEFGFTGWDERTVNSLPDGWMAQVNEAEHCVAIGQPYEGANANA